jgi:hypothetical protein
MEEGKGRIEEICKMKGMRYEVQGMGKSNEFIFLPHTPYLIPRTFKVCIPDAWRGSGYL